MNYYNFHIGDYAVHTRHLSLLEDLAYRRCLDLYYTREMALPADHQQVARLIGMREYADDVLAVLREFFAPCEEGDWVHGRCEAEISKASAKAAVAKANGRKGGRPPILQEPKETQQVSSGLPVGTGSQPPNTQYPIPNTQEETHTSAEPTCPYQKVVDAYHSKLQDLPRVRLMNASRKRAIKKMWGWVMSSTKSDGSRRATNEAEALTWLEDYFARAASNDFLMGRTPRGGDHSGWQCDFDFLLTDRGMKHVIEKTQVAA